MGGVYNPCLEELVFHIKDYNVLQKAFVAISISLSERRQVPKFVCCLNSGERVTPIHWIWYTMWPEELSDNYIAV